MGNLFICTCPGVSDKSANIDINLKPNDMNINQKNNNTKIVENRTIANNNVNINKDMDVNNNINNSIYSNSNNIKKENQVFQSISSNSLNNSFNRNKSITPSNNPLDGLVKIIPKNEQ